MKLSGALAPIWEIKRALSYGFWPTITHIFWHPFILLHPVTLSRLFFAYVWAEYGREPDEGGDEHKKKLLTPNASGIVLDLGAGYGVTVPYLQRGLVSRYIAVEPNTRMHGEIRQNAARAGYDESKGELLILSCGAQDFEAINLALGGDYQVDTIISILTLCSVPEPRGTITHLVEKTLKPGGQLLYLEHVKSPRLDVSRWQSIWTPIWRMFFDGCCLDRPTHVWIDELSWNEQESSMLHLDGQPEEHIWWHVMGRYKKESMAAESQRKVQGQRNGQDLATTLDDVTGGQPQMSSRKSRAHNTDLATALAPIWEIGRAMSYGLLPTILYIFRHPYILFHPVTLSRIFFAYVWVLFGPGTDEGGYESKKSLLTPNASGIVLDLGAGHGVTMFYLQRHLVTRYIAVEPNTRMHTHIRQNATKAGYDEVKGELLILSCGAQDFDTINIALGGNNRVDTLISILTLCSVPDPQRYIKKTLKPGGQLLYYEHVKSPRPDVSFWQTFWTPVWSRVFDGCCLDRPTHVWIDSLNWDEQESSMWDKEGEPEEHIWWHQLGTQPVILKETFSSEVNGLQQKVLQTEDKEHTLEQQRLELSKSLDDARAITQSLRSRVLDTESKLNAADAELQDTTKRLNEAQSSKAALQHDLDAVRDQMRDTENKLSLARAQVTALEARLIAEGSRSPDLANQLSALTLEKADLEASLRSAQVELAVKTSQAQELETTVTSLKVQLTEADAEKAQLLAQVEKLTARQTDLEKALKESGAKMAALDAEKIDLTKALEGEKADSRVAIQSAQVEAAAKASKAVELAAAIASLKALFTDTDAEKSRLTAELDKLIAHGAEQERSLKDGEAEMAALNAEHADQVKALEGEKANLGAAVQAKEAEATAKASSAAELEKTIASLNAQLADLDTEKNRLSIEIEKLTSHQTERDKLLKESNEKTAVLEAEKADALAAAASKWEALQKEHTSLTHLLGDMEERATTMDQQLNERQAQISALQAAKDALDQAVKEHETNLAKANLEMEELKSAKSTLETKLKDAQDLITGYEVSPVNLNDDGERPTYPSRPVTPLQRQRYEPHASPPQLHFKDVDLPTTPPTSTTFVKSDGSSVTPPSSHHRRRSSSFRFPSFSKPGVNKATDGSTAETHSFEVVNRRMPSSPEREKKPADGGASSFRRRISAVFHTDRPGGKSRRGSLVGSLNKPTRDELLTPSSPRQI
ncbi:hypothetical protein FRB97_001354 [Tulasnella sp. 331]|nr:hypothetical protein FRB97_001354 [Tulasnella sp. 331]